MDLFKNNVVAGVGIAFAATVLAPVLMPVFSRVGRPLAKSIVRGGMMMYEKGREVMAVAGESVEDIMAEVRAEGAAAQAAAAAQPSAAAPYPAPAPAAAGAQAEPPEIQSTRPYGGNGASGANGANTRAPSPDGAPGAEAGNI